ncbi:acyltransferase family protein [Sodalis sp. RH16]|uniref:acyltransferase family protein n=1 Tax=Sodalis sp. RH16 TaxID=3394331 RepID=UPI0039B57C82
MSYYFLPLFLISVLTAFTFITLYNKSFLGIQLPHGNRDGCIDGLRGYLALLVVGHHYMIIYMWLLTGKWVPPKIIYANNMGRIGVAVFFMITGYLFIGKLIRDRDLNSKTNWYKLYFSRFFRIMPLYLLVVSITFFLALYKTNFLIDSNLSRLAMDIIKWFLFVGSSINGYQDTMHISAGVTWTLKYEWAFYFSLPVISFFIKNKFCMFIMAISLLAMFLINKTYFGFESRYAIFFLLGGGISYFRFSVNENIRMFLCSKKSSVIGIVAIMLALLSRGDVTRIDNVLFVFIFFIPIVFGNSIFGLLSKPASVILGEMSYSIYLLHGVILFIFFKLLMPKLPAFSGTIYFSLMPAIFCLVVIACTITFKTIEKPFIFVGKKLNTQLPS